MCKFVPVIKNNQKLIIMSTIYFSDIECIDGKTLTLSDILEELDNTYCINEDYFTCIHSVFTDLHPKYERPNLVDFLSEMQNDFYLYGDLNFDAIRYEVTSNFSYLDTADMFISKVIKYITKTLQHSIMLLNSK